MHRCDLQTTQLLNAGFHSSYRAFSMNVLFIKSSLRFVPYYSSTALMSRCIHKVIAILAGWGITVC